MKSLEELVKHPPLPVALPVTSGYCYDSGAVIDSAVVRDRYLEVIFRHSRNGSDHIWIVATAANSPNSIAIPPQPENYPAETRQVIRLRNTDVAYAALRESHGAWEAFWEDEGVFYAVWAGASQFLNDGEFKEWIDSLQVVR